jgi:hypothetical protein
VSALSFTYGDLAAALESWPESDSTEYVNDIPRIVKMAEIRLVRDLNLEIFDKVAYLPVAINDRGVVRPDNWVATRSLRIDSGEYDPEAISLNSLFQSADIFPNIDGSLSDAGFATITPPALITVTSLPDEAELFITVKGTDANDVNIQEVIRSSDDFGIPGIGTLYFKTVDTLIVTSADEGQSMSVGIYRPGISTPLFLRSWDYCQEYGADMSVRGRPKFYNERNEPLQEIVPTPDQNYVIIERYIARPRGLDAANEDSVSYFSTKHGDVLFAACLMEAEHWLKADDRYGDYKDKYYNELLPTTRLELRRAVRRGDYSPYVPAANPAGG